MRRVSPVIAAMAANELWWAKDYPERIPALPVNPEEGMDDLVLRYRFSFWERVKVLFGQDLYAWMPTWKEKPQWTALFLNEPQLVIFKFPDGRTQKKVLPYGHKKFMADREKSHRRGLTVYSKSIVDDTRELLAPNFESELRKTVREKLEERR